MPSLWLGASFFAIALLIVFFVSGEIDYLVNARVVSGQVVSKSVDGDGDRALHRLVYEIDLEGRRVQGRDRVPADLWHSVAAGDEVPIEYVSRARLAHRVRHDRRSGGSVLLSFVVMLGVFAAVFAAGARRLLAWKRLVSTGVRTEAVVTRVGKGWLSDIGRVRARRYGGWYPGIWWSHLVRYQYRDHLGGSHEGSSGYLSEEAAGRWKSGNRLAVAFDRERPGRSVWLGTGVPGEAAGPAGPPPG